MDHDYDVVVVGSGFGGSTTALRLTEKGYRVCVLEAGRRWSAGTLPTSNWKVRTFIWAPRLGLTGIQRLSILKDVCVLSGAGVGGGSLVYANTLYEPLEHFYADPQWGHVTDWQDELAPHYARATRMLGVVETKADTRADDVIRKVADAMGVADTFHPTPVGVYFGEKGKTAPDPYFGGKGPERTGCIECGGCMVGCRHGAKNTLTRNYLYLAEAAGAEVLAEHEVVDLHTLPDGGYAIVTAKPGRRRARRTLTATQVVFSAGVLGTLKLLMRLRDDGRLPGLSARLGHVVRTNSEAIVVATADRVGADYSEGVAITSSFHPDEHTHIEPVRYPPGSNAMGLLTTVLVDGGGRVPRQLRFAGVAARHPVRFVRSLSVRRWSERSVIILTMQSADNSLRLVRKRRGSRYLASRPGHGDPNPTYLPAANDAARIAADLIGGQPQGSVFEALLNSPTTAHIIGGCCIGDSPDTGVIDPYHRVYGAPGLHVADGSAVSANLGVNPSLTITAMAERAMALWPNKGEADPRPPLGDPYRRIEPVGPAAPVVPTGAPAAY